MEGGRCSLRRCSPQPCKQTLQRRLHTTPNRTQVEQSESWALTSRDCYGSLRSCPTNGHPDDNSYIGSASRLVLRLPRLRVAASRRRNVKWPCGSTGCTKDQMQ